MVSLPKRRQSVRKALLLVSFLLFPIVMNYMSPYVIIDGASRGIANGSLLVFAAMFLASLFVGRLWCGWICPMGGLAELSFAVNGRRVSGKKIDWIKWAIWVPWIVLIAWMVYSAGGYRLVDPLLDTQQGISVAGSPERPIWIAYIIYYLVIGLFLGLSFFAGRRAGCHSLCWMAPFMILGRKLRDRLGAWPALRLQARPEACRDCKTCTTNCPMSLDVNAMVRRGAMENEECILCGTCADGCPSQAIRFRFANGR